MSCNKYSETSLNQTLFGPKKMFVFQRYLVFMANLVRNCKFGTMLSVWFREVFDLRRVKFNFPRHVIMQVYRVSVADRGGRVGSHKQGSHGPDAGTL